MNTPKIKFGDILTFSDEWYRATQREKPKKAVLFVASGKITEQAPGDYLIYVAEKNKSYTRVFHSSFLKEFKEA